MMLAEQASKFDAQIVHAVDFRRLHARKAVLCEQGSLRIQIYNVLHLVSKKRDS
jgi:hypothetical protein